MDNIKKRGNKGKIAAIVSGILIAAFLAAGFGVTAFEIKKNFGRGDYEDPRFTAAYYYDHYKNEYPRLDVSFTSGENTLKGFIYGNDNDKGLIVFAHGIGTAHEGYIGFITSLVDCGWKVFAYDATGSGYSEGSGTRGLAQSVIDLDRALSYAESDERLNTLPVFTVGHSWGGYAAAAVLNYEHDIKASASLSGYYLPDAELYETADGLFGKAGVLIRPFIWSYNKLRFGSSSSVSAVDGINKSGIPVLVVHGTSDDVIHFDGASVIAQKDKITNPDTEYYIFDSEGQNEHSNYLYSKARMEYRKQINHLFEEFEANHSGNGSAEDYEAFFSTLDRELLNETNKELVAMIDEFFSRELAY